MERASYITTLAMSPLLTVQHALPLTVAPVTIWVEGSGDGMAPQGASNGVISTPDSPTRWNRKRSKRCGLGEVLVACRLTSTKRALEPGDRLPLVAMTWPFAFKLAPVTVT